MAGYGLRIAKSQGMEGFTGNTANFPIDPSNTNPIFVGDPVILNAGKVEEFSGATAGAVAPAAILGVFTGWEDTGPTATYGSKDHPYQRSWTGAAGANSPQASVSLPGSSLFWIKGDATIDWASVFVPGARYAMIYAAGSTQYGDSRVTMGAVSATGTIQAHRLVDQPGNVLGGVGSEPIFEVSVVRQQATAADAA